MTWDEALTYSDVVKDTAKEWAYRIGDPSLASDLENTIYIGLVEGVDTSRATGNPRVYVKAACWKIARDSLIKSPQSNFDRSMVSLNTLLKKNQVDDDGELRSI